MRFLEVDNARRQTLEQWELDDYGMDLTEYTQQFELINQQENIVQ